MVRKVSILFVLTILVIGLPLTGIFLSGKPLAIFVSFPPLTKPVDHAPFSWLVFALYLFLTAVVLAVVASISIKRFSRSGTEIPPSKSTFPWWGWGALAGMLFFWWLAWSRLAWFASLQRYTFTPLWLSYILVINGLCYRQSGKSPFLSRPRFFLLLFPVSALLWWYFEYLNQFVNNWYYTGGDQEPLAYSLHASIAFSTVLPAVYSTNELVGNTRWIRHRFQGITPFFWCRSTVFLWIILLAGCAGLAGIGMWPEELFPILWLAPLLILTSLQGICKETTIFISLNSGDWRPIVTAALATLICGFFWEMWNFFSLAKWSYSIPYVHRFQLFEMPILGYLGYLSFGLECMAVVGLADAIGKCCKKP